VIETAECKYESLRCPALQTTDKRKGNICTQASQESGKQALGHRRKKSTTLFFLHNSEFSLLQDVVLS